MNIMKQMGVSSVDHPDYYGAGYHSLIGHPMIIVIKTSPSVVRK